METTIQRKLTIKQMEKMFDATNLLNIRHYTPSNKNVDTTTKEPIYFNIRVRHAEDEDVSLLFNGAKGQHKKELKF